MRRVSLFVAALLAAVLFRTVAAAADMTAAEEQERMTLAGGAWHPGKFVPCADGIVTSVQPRLNVPGAAAKARFDSGVAVEFKLPTTPKFLNGQAFSTARVVHYDSDLRNKAMESERPGDSVQVCFVSFPTPTHDLQTGKSVCDPNFDSRGMVYRVYDYKRHFAYSGPDAEHSCGGA